MTSDSIVTAQPTATSRRSSFVFSLPIFLGAFLLFMVQPLIAKYILPWFGGTSAVWTTCMLAFQVLLLAGYAYAHASSRYLGLRAQVGIHVVLLIGALIVLPIVPDARWQPADADYPVWRILMLLLATVGLPYFVLSATSPLLQAWFVRTRPGVSPYRLYALSNMASLLALVSYPLVIERIGTRAAQASAFGWLMVAFAAACVLCGVAVIRSPDAGTDAQPATPAPPSRALSFWRCFAWIYLSATGSILLLAVTHEITQNIAPAPFLWVLPLVVYLLTFVVCFDRPQWYHRPLAGWLVFPLILFAIWLLGGHGSTLVQISGFLSLLFIACMICHGELIKLRPSPQHLTAFYLAIALGGATGGAVAAIAAPLLFNGYYELHLALISVIVILLVAFAVDPASRLYRGRMHWGWPVMIGAAALVSYALWAHATSRYASSLANLRDFYNVVTVQQHEGSSPDDRARALYHGPILHGLQFTAPDRRREATAYFSQGSGVSRAFDLFESPRRVGVVGLGAGTLAAYGRTGDYFRFYEISPVVARAAREHFTFLSDTPAVVDVVLGDGRLSLEREPAQSFDLLILDAFSGDAIPTHLLTVEAFQIYIKHLKSRGLIAVQITNRHVDLKPVVHALAAHFNMKIVYILQSPRLRALGHNIAPDWVLLARDENLLDHAIIQHAATVPAASDRQVLWTDDRQSLLDVLRWTSAQPMTR